MAAISWLLTLMEDVKTQGGPMEKQLHPFTHHDVQGAVIRILDDEILSLNEFLPPEHQLADGDEADFSYTCCYLCTKGKHLLIDAGFDPDTTPGALEALDVSPEDIEWVLLTHADRDHVAGLLMPDGSLTYPKARHVIGKELWQHLSSPETLDALDSERRAFYVKLINALDESIQLCEGPTDLGDGIRFIPCPGHRVGHAAYEVSTSATPLIHSGDAFLHPVFFDHPDWPNAIDTDPERAVVSREILVARAVESHALILATHLPFPGMGFIRDDAATRVWESAHLQEGEHID